ncbi:hypothetical protein [Snuella lapsa]|uniref:Uncharacterized protein n=1 Tax=Snuella lapsa TaxID=870481 RepID=A0ABP6XN52_9FLAO
MLGIDRNHCIVYIVARWFLLKWKEQIIPLLFTIAPTTWHSFQLSPSIYCNKRYLPRAFISFMKVTVPTTREQKTKHYANNKDIQKKEKNGTNNR